MAHGKARQLLAEAQTMAQRQQAVLMAIKLGMPLYQIEQYLDWLDQHPDRHGARAEHTPPAPHIHQNQKHPQDRDSSAS